MRRLTLILSLLAVAAIAQAATANAATGWQTCPGAGTEIECASFSMPLDRTGAIGGTTTVRATRLPAAEGPRMGTIFVISGGPGQSSDAMVELIGYAFVGANRYDIIAIDQRGTGNSEPLVCPRIEAGDFRWDGGDPLTDQPITACSNALGPARSAYNTYEAVEDVETIRADLGVETATFFGVSYGTKVALAYAKAHPSHAKALLLDSVVPTDAPESFDIDSLAALRRVLTEICAGGRCNGVGGVPTTGLARLATRLARRPIELDPRLAGAGRVPPLDDDALYGIVFAADFNSFIYNQLPGAVTTALAGNTAQLERLYAISAGSFVAPSAPSIGGTSFSNTMFLATTCADLIPPWTRSGDLTGRQAAIDSAAAAIDPAALSPFPRATVSANSLAAVCRGWHQSPSPPPIAQGPLPQIPTLTLAGSLDLRTPVSWATRGVAGNPSAEQITIPNVGHSTIGMDASGCALSLARRFLIFGATDGKCRRSSPAVPIAPRAARSINAVRPAAGSCSRSLRRRCRSERKRLTASYLALRDTLDQYMIGFAEAGPGLYDGYWTTEYDFDDLLDAVPASIELQDVSSAIGSSVSGSIDIQRLPRVSMRLRTFGSRVRVSGRVALDRRGDSLTLTSGRGSSRVRIRIRPRAGASANRFTPTRARLAFRRSYVRAASPASPRPSR